MNTEVVTPEVIKKRANVGPDGREEALAYFESLMLFSADNQRSETTTVAMAKERFSQEAIEFAVLTLTTRGFNVERVEGIENPTYKVST